MDHQHSPFRGDIADAAAHMRGVTLPQLETAQLHDRWESKVMLPTADVPTVLRALGHGYSILDHEGERLQGYRTQYFDSNRLRNYHEHHNKKRRRLKLRYRTYLNSDLTFFELKRNVDGKTVKERQLSRRPQSALWPDDAQFFVNKTGRDARELEPSLTVDYRRILLVKNDFSERVTIDLDLSFVSPKGATRIPGLSICEFKQPKLDRKSPAMAATRRRPQKFSKYCMGLASCDPSLRRNRFIKVFRSVDALTTQASRQGLAA